MSEEAAPRRERDPIGSLVRVLGVLMEFDDRAVGVRELARALELSPSTVQRTLESAHNSSIVAPTKDGKWRIGWELYRIASFVTRHNPFLVCQDELDRLSADLNETVVLTVLDLEKSQRMFVASSESRRPVRFVPDLYTWLPALAGATGMAIVANLPGPERRRIHDRTPAPSRPARLATVDGFEETCARIRVAGYALSENEVDLGACSVAVPIDVRAGLTCALGIIVPQQRFVAPEDATLHRIQTASAAVAAHFGTHRD